MSSTAGLVYTLKPAPDLTDAEVRACISLSMRNNGSMADDLRWFRTKAKRRSRVTMVHEDGVLVAWSLQTKESKTWSFHVYVRRTHRGRGLARELLARARMGKRRPLLVYPHSVAAKALYADLIARNRLVDDWN